MLFNSIEFAGFFLLVYTLYLLLNHRWQNRMLLAASYWFYGSWNWRFLSLILISTAVDFFCGRRIHESKSGRARKLYLLLSLTANLGMLGLFKYFNFFMESFESMVGLFGWRPDAVTLNVVLPVGISFYTFQTLSYTIDIYRRELKPEKSLPDFALFIAFFPQLVAGPIERAKRLLPQICRPRTVTPEKIARGLWLICWGYFLKVFVADNLSIVVERVFGENGSICGAETLAGIYAFAFQIFGDFAGYSSIAIGVAGLMGIDLMTNFRFPYFVTNPSAFWQHWHISLSSWLRDYLYFSLGGNRGGRLLTYRNLFLTMLIGGLWHGAAWTFVLWGLYQGIILIVHRLTQPLLSRIVPTGFVGRVWLAVRVLFMFHVTCFGWLIFRAQSIAQLGDMARSIFLNFSAPSQTVSYYLFQVVFYSWIVIAVQAIQMRSGDVRSIDAIPIKARLPLVLFLFYLVVIWGEYGSAEFIYFQF